MSRSGPPADKVLRGKGLSELFGLEMAAADDAVERRRRAPVPRGKAGSAAADRTAADHAGERRGRAYARPGNAGSARKRRRPAVNKRGRAPKQIGRAKGRRRRWPPGKAALEALIADAIVDAYGESEQRTGFYTKIEESLALPFKTELLGAAATVERIDLTAADEIVAVLRRGAKRQRIPILDLPLPQPPPPGAEWIEAYKRWARGLL